MRRVIDRAAAFIPKPRHAFLLRGDARSCGRRFLWRTRRGVGASGRPFGASACEVFSATAEASALGDAADVRRHLDGRERACTKTEPIVADGGEVIIYAPHISEISYMHGKVIRQIGYHVRDYFVKQWDKFKNYPWGVVAHSTHLRGIGTYDNGIEKPRINVTLATSISREVCEQCESWLSRSERRLR